MSSGDMVGGGMGMAKGEAAGMVGPVEEKDQQKVVGKRGRNRSREKVWSEYMTRRPTTTPHCPVSTGVQTATALPRHLAVFAIHDKMLANVLVNGRPMTTPTRQWKHNTEETLNHSKHLLHTPIAAPRTLLPRPLLLAKFRIRQPTCLFRTRLLATTRQLASPANKRQNTGDKGLTPKRTPRCGGAGVLGHRLTLLLLLEGRHEEVVAAVVLLGVGIGG
ncbi:hypothetical protein B0H14DRAFT_2606174 [Mycena olivaceomarginata]|nr:hypothetical protein B0H14DRAFT_2606174 [Mycena olivaceomarginata]